MVNTESIMACRRSLLLIRRLSRHSRTIVSSPEARPPDLSGQAVATLVKDLFPFNAVSLHYNYYTVQTDYLMGVEGEVVAKYGASMLYSMTDCCWDIRFFCLFVFVFFWGGGGGGNCYIGLCILLYSLITHMYTGTLVH